MACPLATSHLRSWRTSSSPSWIGLSSNGVSATMAAMHASLMILLSYAGAKMKSYLYTVICRHGQRRTCISLSIPTRCIFKKRRRELSLSARSLSQGDDIPPTEPWAAWLTASVRRTAFVPLSKNPVLPTDDWQSFRNWSMVSIVISDSVSIPTAIRFVVICSRVNSISGSSASLPAVIPR